MQAKKVATLLNHIPNILGILKTRYPFPKGLIANYHIFGTTLMISNDDHAIHNRHHHNFVLLM